MFNVFLTRTISEFLLEKRIVVQLVTKLSVIYGIRITYNITKIKSPLQALFLSQLHPVCTLISYTLNVCFSTVLTTTHGNPML